MGYLFALLAALLFGANGPLTKLIVDSGISATQLSQFRTLGTAVAAGLLMLAFDRRGFRLGWRQLLTMLALGIVGLALLQVSYASALARLPVGIGLLLEYLAVLFVALVAFLFFKEKVRARLWLAIGCVLVGLVLVSELWASTLDVLGVLLALGAAVCLTVYFVLGERGATGAGPLATAFWTALFATGFWAPLSGWWTLAPSAFASPVQAGGALGDFSVPMWVLLVVTVLLGSFAPFLLSFAALSRLSATAVGVIASSEVLFAFLSAWIWLGETLQPIQLVGAAIVFVGIVLAQTARQGHPVDADLAVRPDATTL